MTLVLSAFAMSAHAALDLRANEQPLPVTRDPQAIAKIPPGYRFVCVPMSSHCRSPATRRR